MSQEENPLNDSLQLKLMAVIKNKLSSGQSLGRELADLLHLSQDSVYRRMRGETSLTIDELALISKHFEVSIDDIIGMQNSGEAVLFRFYRLSSKHYQEYLQFILAEFRNSENMKGHNLVYSAKDIPIFYFFLFPELAVFKGYFFSKVLWPSDLLKDSKFTFQKIYKELGPPMEILNDLGIQLAKAYMSIPGSEIWNHNTINGHLYQISYMWEAGLFDDIESALFVLNSTRLLVKHIEEQASAGFKLATGENENKRGAFEMYFSEGIHLENAIIRNAQDQQRCYVLHNTGDYLITSDIGFCKRTTFYLENVLRKSSLISTVGEKDRKRLFRNYYEKIEKLEKQIENS